MAAGRQQRHQQQEAGGDDERHVRQYCVASPPHVKGGDSTCHTVFEAYFSCPSTPTAPISSVSSPIDVPSRPASWPPRRRRASLDRPRPTEPTSDVASTRMLLRGPDPGRTRCRRCRSRSAAAAPARTPCSRRARPRSAACCAPASDRPRRRRTGRRSSRIRPPRRPGCHGRAPDRRRRTPASLTTRRASSATLHAWAMQPRGVNGASASKISLTEPTHAVVEVTCSEAVDRSRAPATSSGCTASQASTNGPISHGQTVPWW